MLRLRQCVPLVSLWCSLGSLMLSTLSILQAWFWGYSSFPASSPLSPPQLRLAHHYAPHYDAGVGPYRGRRFPQVMPMLNLLQQPWRPKLTSSEKRGHLVSPVRACHVRCAHVCNFTISALPCGQSPRPSTLCRLHFFLGRRGGGHRARMSSLLPH